MTSIRLTAHALQRLAERSTMLPTELCALLSYEAYSKVGSKGKHGYYVVWDGKAAKALLLVTTMVTESEWTIITIRGTWECDVAHGSVQVWPGHIAEARSRRARYLQDKADKENEYARSLLRFDLIVGRREEGFLVNHQRINEFFKLMPADFVSLYDSDWQQLLAELVSQGVLDDVPVNQGDNLYLEIWHKKSGGKREVIARHKVL